VGSIDDGANRSDFHFLDIAMPDKSLPDPVNIIGRLEALEKRLTDLEKVLSANFPGLIKRGFLPVQIEQRSPPPAPAHSPNVERIPEAELFEEAAVPRPGPAHPAPGRPIRVDATKKSSAQTRERDFEQTIGLKWAGWAGAIILVIGVGFGIHFAYQQGWFGHIPVRVRLFLMSLAGFALLGAGEAVYRRIGAIASVGIFAAGVGVLFVVSYAGNIYFQAYDYEAASVFAILTTLIGSAVAIRGRLVSIAVLSQIGGQLAPYLLSSGQPPGLPLLTYLLMLEAVALILALWGNSPKWWALRVVSLAATAWWVSICLRHGQWSQGIGNEVLLFSILYASAYQGELLRSAFRASDAGGPAEFIPEGWGTAYSLLVTAGLTGVALQVFYDYDSAFLRGAATLVLACLTLGTGFALPAANRLVRALRDGYRVQGMALLMLFVPVAFSGLWICMAWGILALAFGVIGARFDRPLARAASVVTWALALLRLLEADAHVGLRSEVWMTAVGTNIHGVTGTAWLLAIAGLCLAVLLVKNWSNASGPQPVAWLRSAVGLGIGASLVWIIASFGGLPALGATLALIVWAWILVGADYLEPRMHLAGLALVVLALATAHWATRDAFYPRLAPDWAPLKYYPVFNPVMGLAVLIASSFVAVTRLRPNIVSGPTAEWSSEWIQYRPLIVTSIVLGIMTVGLALEVDRLVERMAALDYHLGWPKSQLKLLGLTWVFLAMVLVLTWMRHWIYYPNKVAWYLLIVVGIKFLLLDMVWGRFALANAPANVIVLLNFQIVTALAVVAMPLLLAVMTPLDNTEDSLSIRAGTDFLTLLVVLGATTLEVDRLFSGPLARLFKDPQLAGHAAISIYWSLFAITTVVAGFRYRIRGLRYFGLGLFCVTLLKVATVDMREVQYGYRILALVGLGLLLLATSVVYGKVGSKLLGAGPESATEAGHAQLGH
jgi:hypothetical protein